MPPSVLPGLWVAGCALLLGALLRRAGEPLPWRVALAHLALVFSLLWPVLLGGRVLLPLDVLRGFVPFRELPAPAMHGNYLQRDLLTLIAPAQQRVRAALLDGEWPLLDEQVGTGVPLLADPQAQPFQPLVLLALPFPVPTAAGVVAALRLLAALAFTFLLLRRHGVGEGAALAGSLAWGCGGWMMLWLGWPLANAGALLPLALWAAARWMDRGSRRDALLVAAAAATLGLAGHPEAVLDSFALLGAYVVARGAWRAGGTARRSVLGWAAATALGLLLAAPALLPAAGAAGVSARAAGLAARAASPNRGTSAVVAPAWEGEWRRLARGRWVPVLAPNAFGNDRYLAYWGPENVNEDAAGFVGTVTLLLALVGFVPGFARGLPSGARRYPAERLLQGAVVVGLLLMALPAPLRALSDRLPLALQSASHYHRLLLVVGLALVVLAAYTLDRVGRGEVGRGRTLAAALLLGGLVTWAYLAHPAPPGIDELAPLREGSLRWHLRCLAGGTVLLLLARGRRTVAAATPWAAAALVAAELLLLHAPANPAAVRVVPGRAGLPRSPALDFVRRELDGRRMSGAGEVIPPNVATLYGLADVRAYAPMAPAWCAAALAPVQRPSVSDLASDRALRARLARAGVGLVLAPPASDAPPPRGIRVAYSDTAAAVYELPGAWPRAGLLEVPGGGRRLITTLCDDGGRRVLAAGRPVPSGRDDGGFLAARLPPDGDVHLLYRPRGLLAGCALGAAAASLVLLALLAPPRSGRRRQSR